jgi:hypothetical protein
MGTGWRSSSFCRTADAGIEPASLRKNLRNGRHLATVAFVAEEEARSSSPERVANLLWVQRQGGWASPKMLPDVYGHFMPTESSGYADNLATPDAPCRCAFINETA